MMEQKKWVVMDGINWDYVPKLYEKKNFLLKSIAVAIYYK